MEEVQDTNTESMPMMEAKEVLRYQIDFEAILKLPKEQKDFYLGIIKREANNYDIRELIAEYLSKYNDNIFNIENQEVKDYFIKNSEILSSHTMVKMMKVNNLIIDHREANINEALN